MVRSDLREDQLDDLFLLSSVMTNQSSTTDPIRWRWSADPGAWWLGVELVALDAEFVLGERHSQPLRCRPIENSGAATERCAIQPVVGTRLTA